MTQGAVDPVGSVTGGSELPPPEVTFDTVQKSVESKGDAAAASSGVAVTAEETKVSNIDQLRTDPALKPIYDAIVQSLAYNMRSQMQGYTDRLKAIRRQEYEEG